MEHAASFNGIPPEEAAFSEILHTYALYNFNPGMIEEATMKFKLAHGTAAFARAILQDYHGHRVFCSPVQGISQSGNTCTVILESGREYGAQAIISTIPWNMLPSITFEPLLSALRQDAFSIGNVPTKIDKLLATTSTDLPNGFNISCEGGDMPFASGFKDGEQGGQPLLTFLCQPNVNLDTDGTNIRLVESLHPDGLKLTSVRAHIFGPLTPMPEGWCTFDKLVLSVNMMRRFGVLMGEFISAALISRTAGAALCRAHLKALIA